MAEHERINVLYLSYDGMTDPLGESQVLPYIIGLSSTFNFTLISFEKKKRFTAGQDRINNIIRSHPIKWLPQTYHKFPPVISTVRDILKMARLARKEVLTEEIKLIHCRSYPPGLVGLWLKRKQRIRFLFDIRGFWANERVDGGIWNLANPIYQSIYNFFKRKEVEMMSEADHIISLTFAGKEEIVSGRLFHDASTSISEKKITVIPCAVDLDLFNRNKITDQKKSSLRKQLGISENTKLLVYLGSLGTWYLLEEMLVFFKKWNDKFETYKFLFVSQDDKELIYEQAEVCGIQKSDLIITKSSRSDVPLHLSISDVGIFFIKPDYSKKASSATKMGEIMAMGLPFVTNEGIGDTDFILHKCRGGLAVDVFNYDINEIETNLASGDFDINFAELADFYSLKSGIKKYINAYNNLMNL